MAHLAAGTSDDVEPASDTVTGDCLEPGTVIHGVGYTLHLASPIFEAYYQMQGVVGEGEWDAFMTALRRPLPVTLRINALDPSAGRWVLGVVGLYT